MHIVAEEYDEGQRPGNRVGDQQDLIGADRRSISLVVVESCVHPGETQTAASDDGRDHREDGALDAAEHAGAAVHEAAEEVRHDDTEHAREAESYAFGRIRKIQKQQRFTENVRERAERQTDECDRQERRTVDRIQTVVPLRAVVLAREGHTALCERIHTGVDERIDIHARGITRHAGCAERVNARLDDDVRKGEQCVLKSHRKAELHDLCERLFMDAELEDEDPALAIKMEK